MIWTVELDVQSENPIGFQIEGMDTDDFTIETIIFDGIHATTQEIDNMINKLTNATTPFVALKLPPNYEIYSYIVPVNRLVSVTVKKETNDGRTTSTVEDFLDKKNDNGN